MGNITDFLDEIERLAYKILLWVLLLPKTLLKIILEPNWVPGYVKTELSGDSKQAFDNYMSPVVLFLIVTLIPTILLAFTPSIGMTVSQPVPLSEDDLRTMIITADGKFISSTGRVFHKVWWEVWEVDQSDQAGNPMGIEYGYGTDRSYVYYDDNGNEVQDPSFTFVYGELHDQVKGEKSFSISDQGSGERTVADEQFFPSQISLLNNNTIEDSFYYLFEQGEYQVRVFMENYDPNDHTLIESQNDTIYVTVPEDATQDIYFDSVYMVSGEDGAVGTTAGLSLDTLQTSLESGGTYLLALGLLSLPLLFSFGTKLLGEEGLGETSLKKSFYMQCYYFSPVTAVFWSSIYAVNFYTSDIYGLAIAVPFVMFALIIIWFWGAEVHAIALERGISNGRAWGVLVTLMVVLIGGSSLIYLVLSDLDILRRYSIMLYPLAGMAVFIAYFVKRRRERILAKKKAETPIEPLT